MDKDSSNISSLSEDDNSEKNKDLNIKTLNPEQDLHFFLKEMNFKQCEIDIKYPKVIFYYLSNIFNIFNI